MTALPDSLLNKLLSGSVEVTAPYKWYLKQVKVSVDLYYGTSTVLGGTMRYIGRNEIEDPIFGKLNDEGAPVVPHHFQAWL